MIHNSVQLLKKNYLKVSFVIYIWLQEQKNTWDLMIDG